jgi:Bifunctional DNA primase/polymerase, N-terminal/Primase C terminal 1 (PriCT-1)
VTEQQIAPRDGARKFFDWQAAYAARKIPTFPLQGKQPLVSNFQMAGLDASAQWALKFPDALAIGFVAGKRTRITVLDVDEPGDGPLHRALDVYGETPIIVRTATGKHHAWFRYNGEARRIKPVPGIDILGAGVVVAPPSRGLSGAQYEFICGSLDDIERLPALRNVLIAKPASQMAGIGARNNTLFEVCMRAAKSCDDFEQLLDVARTRNEFPEPLPDAEVVKIATQAWGYTARGENFFGRGPGVWFAANEVVELTVGDPDTFRLLSYLRAKNAPGREFFVANGLAKDFKWGSDRLAAARKQLLCRGYIELVKGPGRRTPALYRWKDRRRAKEARV